MLEYNLATPAAVQVLSKEIPEAHPKGHLKLLLGRLTGEWMSGPLDLVPAHEDFFYVTTLLLRIHMPVDTRAARTAEAT